MAGSFLLSAAGARGLARDHERLRSQIYSQQPVRLQQRVISRSARKNTAIGLTVEEIPALLDDVAGFGEVLMEVVQDAGILNTKTQVIRAYNLGPVIPPLTHVELIVDWDTGRWLIVTGPATLAKKVYFKATESFTFADASFAADLKNYFDGSDPRPDRWSISNSDIVINPATDAGHFFQGVSGVFGFAIWHDADAVNPGSPVGYWAEQLECITA